VGTAPTRRERCGAWCAKNVLTSYPHALQLHGVISPIFFTGQHEARKDVAGGAEVYLAPFRARRESMVPQWIYQALQDRSCCKHPLHDEVQECVYKFVHATPSVDISFAFPVSWNRRATCSSSPSGRC